MAQFEIAPNKRYSVVYEPLWWSSDCPEWKPKEIVVFESDSRIMAKNVMKTKPTCAGTNPFCQLILRDNNGTV